MLLRGIAAIPRVAHAQQSEGMRTLAMLSSTDSGPYLDARVLSFQQELQRLGWIEGRNLRFVLRNSVGDPQTIRTDAAELVALAPDIIVTSSNLSTVIVSRLTRTIPIVFANAGDPVGTGLVANMARPGGNITGFASYEVAIGGKWMELLKELVPRLSRVTMLYTVSGGGSEGTRRVLESAAPGLGVRVTSVPAVDLPTIEQAVGALAASADAGLIVLPGPSTASHSQAIIESAIRHRIPAEYNNKFFTVAGGLMSYSSDPIDLYRRSASYVDRILRGEKPGDLPVQAPTKFELVINLKAAKTMGLTI